MKTLDQREGQWGEVGSQSLSCPSREPGLWWPWMGFENEKLSSPVVTWPRHLLPV